MNDHTKTIPLDEPITAHMRRSFARLHPNERVGDAVDRLRRDPPEDRIVYFYAVDDEGRLQGVVPTRRLILSMPDQRVGDIMLKRLVTLPAEATVAEACEFFIQHRLLALPVVDAQRRLLGVVDVELYTDELGEIHRAAQRDDLFQLVGVRGAEARGETPWQAFRRRFPWLGCNLAGGLLAAVLAGLFEETLSRVVVLALFIPVVLNLAESVSSQSVSLTLHALAGGRPSGRSVLRQLRSEAPVGALLGLACGLVVALMAWGWRGNFRVAATLLGAVAAGVLASALLGMALPVLLRLLRLDPRVAAGPIALAAADVVTILLYFNLARALLG
jgi:magnesium transporter